MISTVATVQDDGQIVFSEEMLSQFGIDANGYVLFGDIGSGTCTATFVSAGLFEAEFQRVFGRVVPNDVDLDEYMMKLQPELVAIFERRVRSALRE